MNYRELHLKLEIILLFVLFSLKFNLKDFRLQLGEMKLSELINLSKGALIAVSVRCWVRWVWLVHKKIQKKIKIFSKIQKNLKYFQK